MNNKQSDLLVIIVSYNSMRWAKRCYDSLRFSTVKCDVITIDNGSTDGTIEFIRTNYPEVDIVKQNKNIGFGQANNIGLQRVLDGNYKFAYLLNQDAWVLPDTFNSLIEIANVHPEFGILSPMQMQSDLCHLDLKFQIHVTNKCLSLPQKLEERQTWPTLNNVYEVSFVMAAHWLITRECINRTGGFSPTFFLYGEDDNYINRAHFWNYKVGIVPQALAVHERNDSNWSSKKNNYICYYTTVLSKCSNPAKPLSLLLHIKYDLATSIKNLNLDIFKYAVRLIIESYTIKKNLKKSILPKAFLQ